LSSKTLLYSHRLRSSLSKINLLEQGELWKTEEFPNKHDHSSEDFLDLSCLVSPIRELNRLKITEIAANETLVFAVTGILP